MHAVLFLGISDLEYRGVSLVSTEALLKDLSFACRKGVVHAGAPLMLTTFVRALECRPRNVGQVSWTIALAAH